MEILNLSEHAQRRWFTISAAGPKRNNTLHLANRVKVDTSCRPVNSVIRDTMYIYIYLSAVMEAGD